MVSIPPYLPIESDYSPTHPDLFLIHFAKGDFASSLITQQVRILLLISLAVNNALWLMFYSTVAGL
jgi:hypothetical protein